MAQDTYTEVTSKGWFSRLGGAFKGILIGLILMGIATWLLFSNEGRAVRTARTLKEGGGAVIAVAADQVDAANEGRLVHVAGTAQPDNMLIDTEFMVSADAVHLERTVEMYQWQEHESRETKKKVGGGTETTTTYSYTQGWSEQPINSTGFKVAEGHENPGGFPFNSSRWTADRVALGAFELSSGLVGKMSRFEPLPVTSADALPPDMRVKARVQGGGLYIGTNPSSPQIGDIKVSFRYSPPATVSVVGKQTGASVGPYLAKAGGTIELLSYGVVAPEVMFQAAEQQNTVMTWLLRLGGLVLMFLGLRMIFRPLSVLADVLPFLGNIVEAGTGIISFLIAAFLSASIIAVAWILYRPLIGLTMLALAIALIAGIITVLRKAGRQRSATAAG